MFFVFFSLWFLFVFAATVSAEFLKTKQNKIETSTVVVARAVIYNFAVIGSFYLFFFGLYEKNPNFCYLDYKPQKPHVFFSKKKWRG